MSEVLNLITRCRELGLELAPGPEGKLRVKPPGRLPEELREELRRHKAAILAWLRQAQKHPRLSEEERDFLTQHARNLPWQESPGWEALMVWSKVLGFHVWLVRDRETAEQYARETGTPALIISEVVELKGIPTEKARGFLLVRLITSGGVQ